MRASSVPVTCRSPRPPRAWSCIPSLGLATSAPFPGVDPATRNYFGDQIDQFNQSVRRIVAMAPPPDYADGGSAWLGCGFRIGHGDCRSSFS